MKIYNLKRVLPILGIAGATLLPACRGHQNEPEPVKNDTTKTEIQKHDTTLYFAPFALDPIVPDNVKEVLNIPNIANIYMEPIGEKFDRSGAKYIHSIRVNGLEPNINMDPERVHGRGNFVFYPGEVYPEDSLWFVQHGWTVNQQNQQ